MTFLKFLYKLSLYNFVKSFFILRVYADGISGPVSQGITSVTNLPKTGFREDGVLYISLLLILFGVIVLKSPYLQSNINLFAATIRQRLSLRMDKNAFENKFGNNPKDD